MIRKLKYYSFLISSLIIGTSYTIWAFYFDASEVSKGLAILIDFILLIINIVIDQIRLKACPKCKKWTNIDKIGHRTRESMLMPEEFSALKKYKCYECGHTWSEYVIKNKNRGM